MPDIRNTSPTCGGQGRDSVYIDTNRILDRCRDKDCYEDVVVYLSDAGSELLERSGSVRTKCAKVICANIHVDSVPFNRGFYQISITMYIKIVCEVCACMGRPQEVEGIAVVEKKVILYGSEGNVNIFKSEPGSQNFCGCANAEQPGTNLPIAVFEVADPIVLNTKIVEACECHNCHSCLSASELPESVCSCINGRINCEPAGKVLTVSLGFFSVVRIERPAQYLVHGTEYTVPEKECVSPATDDPCKMFKHMAFPINEFYPPSLCDVKGSESDGMNGGCGCGKR